MKKKIALICAAVMLIACIAQPVGAVNVIMNSSFLKFPDQEPVVTEGSTLVPLRAVGEALGLEVTWDDPTDTVVLKKDNFYIELVIGSTKAKTPGGVKELGVAPKIINGRTMVPLRFIAEELGLTVLWNQEYQRVIINGQVDTQTIVKPPVEETTDVAGEVEESASEVKEGEALVEEVVEEETDFTEVYTVIETPAASILLNIPDTYEIEDTDNEESFAYRSLDGFDAQHTYNWEIVSQYESYADDGGSGILFIVQEQAPYEGDEYDIARATDDYPERPERPEVDFGYIFSEVMRLMIEQACADNGVEVPEDMENLPEDEEELAQLVGFGSAEEYGAYMKTIDTQALMEEIPEYVEYREWQMLDNEYKTEAREIDNARNYAVRHFDNVYEELDDEAWAKLFSDSLNTDSEVRYEGVEVLEIDEKKVIHAVIYAEDPDDEQGTYEYYRYQDGDTLVTIFGGTLYSGEPSAEISDILANMIIQ